LGIPKRHNESPFQRVRSADELDPQTRIAAGCLPAATLPTALLLRERLRRVVGWSRRRLLP